MVEVAVPLAGGLTALHDGGSKLFLLPARPELRECQRLLGRCLHLHELSSAPGGPGRRLPGTERAQWIPVPEKGLLLLPELEPPAGLPLEAWLASPGAHALGLVAALTEVVRLVDLLAGAGFRPEGLGLDGVWVDNGAVTWLPAALGWSRRGRLPTGENLRAAGRTVAVFLHKLLQACRALPGMEAVWEELWALCHDLLERGQGTGAGWTAARLEQLHRRLYGWDEGVLPTPDSWVLVDAASIQRFLRYQTLDLAGLLRFLLGEGRRIEGAVLTHGRLPIPVWQEQARAAGLAWAETAEPRDLGHQARSRQAEEIIFLCGDAAAVSEMLPWLRPERGVLIALGSTEGAQLPERWGLASLNRPLDPWTRIGWSGRRQWRGVEVPGDVHR